MQWTVENHPNPRGNVWVRGAGAPLVAISDLAVTLAVNPRADCGFLSKFKANFADFEFEFQMVGREGVEPPKLSRRFYKPLHMRRRVCDPARPLGLSHLAE
jgi:hypothetical protein